MRLLYLKKKETNNEQRKNNKRNRPLWNKKSMLKQSTGNDQKKRLIIALTQVVKKRNENMYRPTQTSTKVTTGFKEHTKKSLKYAKLASFCIQTKFNNKAK